MINVDSPKALNTVVGHETTHLLEGTTEYHELRDAIFEYARTKGEFENRQRQIEELYKNVENVDIETELTADLVGDYLFTDSQFIQSLSVQKPTLFQKIKSLIDDLIVRFTGTKEERQLREIQKKFREAYLQESFTNNTKFSIGEEIEKDSRKLKFRNYSNSQSYFELDYDIMREINAIVSSKAHKSVNGNELNFVQLIETDNNYYDISADILGDDYYNITNAEKINDEIVGEVNERYKTRYNDNFDRSTINEQRTNDDNIKSFENGTKGKEILEYNKRNDVKRDGRNKLNQNGELNTRFSLTQDNQGRELSPQQQEYFKDSKAIDDKGNLKELYHGTPNDFSVFNYDKLGTNGTLLGKGFYLTDDINVGKAYANKGESGKVMTVYADIKKPLKWGEKSISKSEYKSFVEAINQATDGRLIADYSGEFAEKGSKAYNDTLNDILMDYEYGGDDIDLVSGIINSTGMNWGKAYKILTETTGYDGIIVTTDVYDSGEGNVYIPFQSSQIKNVDNLNPTTNEDIRMSLGKEQNKLNGDYKIYGEDVKKQNIDSDEIAPIKQEKTNVTEDIKTVTKELTKQVNEIKENVKAVQESLQKELSPFKEVLEEMEIPGINEEIGIGDSENDMILNADMEMSPTNTLELKERRWTRTSTESKSIKDYISIDDLDADKVFYKVQSNKKTLDRANKNLARMGYDESLNYFKAKLNDRTTTVEDVVLGERLIQEALNRGDNKKAIDLIQDVAILGTDLGRQVQALSMIQRMTPEGQLSTLQKIVTRNQVKGDKAFNNVNITDDMIDKIMGVYQEDGSYSQQELNQAVEDVKQEIADQMTTTIGDKAKSWRYLSMLGNPKHILET